MRGFIPAGPSRIVDIGAAKMADTPEASGVIVMPNLYGGILSDVAAQIAGSVGLAGSARGMNAAVEMTMGVQCFSLVTGLCPARC